MGNYVTGGGSADTSTPRITEYHMGVFNLDKQLRTWFHEFLKGFIIFHLNNCKNVNAGVLYELLKSQWAVEPGETFTCTN